MQSVAFTVKVRVLRKQSAPWQWKISQELGGKIRGNQEELDFFYPFQLMRLEKRRGNQEELEFFLPLPTDRAGYATDQQFWFFFFNFTIWDERSQMVTLNRCVHIVEQHFDHLDKWL